jgi:hypothetical protein
MKLWYHEIKELLESFFLPLYGRGLGGGLRVKIVQYLTT